MLHNLSHNLLLSHLYHWLRHFNSCQVSCDFKETALNLVSRFGTHIEGVQVIIFSKLFMLFRLDRLHVVQIYFVAHQDQQGHFLALEGFIHESQPVFQVLKTLLVSDVIYKHNLLGHMKSLTAFASNI